jgi:hypothetical protein
MICSSNIVRYHCPSKKKKKKKKNSKVNVKIPLPLLVVSFGYLSNLIPPVAQVQGQNSNSRKPNKNAPKINLSFSLKYPLSFLTPKPVISLLSPHILSSSSAPPNFPIPPLQPSSPLALPSPNFRFSPVTRQIHPTPDFQISHFLFKNFPLHFLSFWQTLIPNSRLDFRLKLSGPGFRGFGQDLSSCGCLALMRM